MICRKCKSDMPDGLRYCGKCGRRMNIVEYMVFTKKGRIILAAILAGLLLLGLGIVGTIHLLGRDDGGMNHGTSETKPKLGDSVLVVNEKILNSAMDADMKLLTTPLPGEAEAPKYLLDLEARSSYETVSFEVSPEGDFVDAVVQVSSPDLYTAYKEAGELGPMSEAEINAFWEKLVADAAMMETQVNLQFVLIDGVWQPQWTEEFMDAYYGGLMRLEREYYESMLEGGAGFD